MPVLKLIILLFSLLSLPDIFTHIKEILHSINNILKSIIFDVIIEQFIYEILYNIKNILRYFFDCIIEISYYITDFFYQIL